MVLGETKGGKGKRKSFRWWWDGHGQTLHIKRENGQHDRFPTAELRKILQSLEGQFRLGCFPLANNVAKMSKGTEKPGLGMTILGSTRALNGSRPGDIMHAQASSYLGVVFEHVGLTTWNGKHWRIKWHLNRTRPDEELTGLLRTGTCSTCCPPTDVA